MINIRKISYFIQEFLDRPLWVLITCFSVVCIHLAFDGTFVRMWNLYNSGKVLESRIEDIQQKNEIVENRMKELSDSRFLEREVRDRFNLVGEEDIIFIFSDEDL